MSVAPYAVGDRVSIAYEPDSVAVREPRRYVLRPADATLVRATATVQAVTALSGAWWSVEIGDAPGRQRVAYTVDASGAYNTAETCGCAEPVGLLAPDGQPWIEAALADQEPPAELVGA